MTCNFFTKKIVKRGITFFKEAGRKCPFLSPQLKPKHLSLKIEQLQLKDILWDDNKPLAIINSEVVTQGQKIADKKIIKIEKDSVIVQTQNGKNYTVKLHNKLEVK